MAPREGRECFSVAGESKRSTARRNMMVALPNKSLKPTAAIAAAA